MDIFLYYKNALKKLKKETEKTMIQGWAFVIGRGQKEKKNIVKLGHFFSSFFLLHNSVVMTVLSCGILLFSFSFLVEMASEDTSHGEILSRSEALRTLSRSEAFLALLIRFWLLTLELELPLEVGKGNFDLLLLVTEDSDLVTG